LSSPPWALLWLLAWSVAAAAAQSEMAPLVTAVELRSDTPQERLAELLDLVAVEPGEPLDPAAVARTLRNLHSYGTSGEIVAFTRSRPGGVAVIFGLWARIQVEGVWVVGDLGLRRAQLHGALPQRQDQPLSESKVIRGVYALQDLYYTSGYRESVVRVAVAVDQPRKQAMVTYHVDAGPRARIGEISFVGDLGPFSAEDLRPPLRSKAGGHHDEVVAANDVERLGDWLINRGYRRASVDPAVDSYDAAADRVDLEFAVQVGPRFTVEAPGVDLKKLGRKGLVPFLETERFDETLLEQSRVALRRYFQERGHYDVVVHLTQEETADGAIVRLAIERGPLFDLAEVRFRGNEAIGEDQLAALMETSVARRLGSGGRLVDQIIEDDLANIRSFYALQGFGEAEVGPVAVERRGKILGLIVPVIEGPQRRVVNLAFEGTERLAPELLVDGLALRGAGPFHRRLLEQSLEQIRARYEAAGMRATQVAAELIWNEERSLVDVVFKIFEGPRSEVDRVIVRGQQRTRPLVIRRAANLGHAQTLSTERLLEAQRRLYDLGVFSRVDVQMAPGTPFSAERDVIVRVEEGRQRNVTYGFGYDSEDGVRGLLGIGHRNLFGRAIAGRLDFRASQRETQIRALVRQPFLGRSGWPVSYSVFRIEESRDSFDSERRGAQIEGLRLSGSDRYGLLLGYRNVQVSCKRPRSSVSVRVCSSTAATTRSTRTVAGARTWCSRRRYRRISPTPSSSNCSANRPIISICAASASSLPASGWGRSSLAVATSSTRPCRKVCCRRRYRSPSASSPAAAPRTVPTGGTAWGWSTRRCCRSSIPTIRRPRSGSCRWVEPAWLCSTSTTVSRSPAPSAAWPSSMWATSGQTGAISTRGGSRRVRVSALASCRRSVRYGSRWAGSWIVSRRRTRGWSSLASATRSDSPGPAGLESRGRRSGGESSCARGFRPVLGSSPWSWPPLVSRPASGVA
jgi:outer membrane protein assembly factor BamA